jgi:hypothetical protein
MEGHEKAQAQHGTLMDVSDSPTAHLKLAEERLQADGF